MKLPFKARTISTAVVIPSAIIVLALAVLEYRWSTRVSEATAVRLADSLQMSLINWQKDFFRYFSEIGLALRIDPVEEAPADVGMYVRRFAEWRSAARYPELVSNLYLLNLDGSAQRLNTATRRFEVAQWPASFRSLRPDLERMSAEVLHDQALRDQSVPGTRGLYADSSPSANRDDHSAGWRFEPAAPALFHPVVPAAALARGSAAGPSAVNWIAVELNQREIQSRILADLTRNYFQGTDGLDYLAAVISNGEVLYSSDTGFGRPEPPDADGTIDLFGRARNNVPGPPVRVFHVPPEDKGPDPSVQFAWFPFLRANSPDMDWRLVVRHRRGGPLGAFVLEMRRRDLAIGFGMLLVLVINMAMLIVTSHRAQRLAQMQVDFVTAVSHELRTPLTAILSGADNLRNGLVETTQQVAQYGALIGNQARQLFGLVEQILLFAASRQGRLRYNLTPVQVHEVIDASLASTARIIEAAHFTVECEIADDLPKVSGDAAALSQCLQNLITNAVKYGQRDRWIGISATMEKQAPAEIRISVSDRGSGVTEADLPHIFEPFYRGASARDAQIHGTGLGLPLAKSIAEAMNGRLTVTSEPGRGSAFTLCLPAA
jgi:signal transduction histidine kinase